mgnify:CR=1 FL=1
MEILYCSKAPTTPRWKLMQETSAPTKAITPLYVQEISILEGLDDTELEAYMDENPRIVPQFEIDILETASEYVPTTAPHEDKYELDPQSVLELSKAWESLEGEMEIL